MPLLSGMSNSEERVSLDENWKNVVPTCLVWTEEDECVIGK